jgi:lipopolysaccharide/colanic/teichoic acid biosynthesis glycosyltransferase
VSLGAVQNNIEVSVAVYPGLDELPESGNNFVVHTCGIANVPIQRWCNLLISAYGRTLDIYMDGKLVRTCVLPGVSKVDANAPVYITPMGGFLRKSKINELPQLMNIWLGDMSFVGPRPVMPISFDAYPDDVQKVIYNAQPGLTGIGSIVFRDEEELISAVKDKGGDTWDFYKNTIYPFKGKLEQWYQENRGFSVDFKIIIVTACVILKPKSNIVYNWFNGLPTRTF